MVVGRKSASIARLSLLRNVLSGMPIALAAYALLRPLAWYSFIACCSSSVVFGFCVISAVSPPAKDAHQ